MALSIAARRAMREPIIGAASTSRPVLADVRISEHFAAASESSSRSEETSMGYW